ncbi:hypothetical protein SprV_0100302800 [Sparganum proliferum]
MRSPRPGDSFAVTLLRVFADGGKKDATSAIPQASVTGLNINLDTWDDLAQERPARGGAAKIGEAIYEANCIAVTRPKRSARRPRTPRTLDYNTSLLPKCPPGRRVFRVLIGLVEQFRTRFHNMTTPTGSAVTSAAITATAMTTTGEQNLDSADAYHCSTVVAGDVHRVFHGKVKQAW